MTARNRTTPPHFAAVFLYSEQATDLNPPNKQRPAEAGQGRKKNETFYIIAESLPHRRQSSQE